MRKAGFSALLIVAGLWMVSCGGNTSMTTSAPSSKSTMFSLNLRDTPPAGVSILSFEIKVTAAVLHQGSTDVSILKAPVEVEVTQLETESAVLSTQGVPSGTYNSITLTFADPRMTIKNTSGASVGGCASGSVCELSPTLNAASVTSSQSPPFPLNLSAQSATGLTVDFNLNDSVQQNLSIQPTITLTQLPVVGEDGEELEHLDDLAGQISAVGSNQFTLQVPSSGQSFTVLVDSSTQFEDFGEEGMSNSFSSLKTGQVVEVSAKLNGDGSLLASKVELKQPEQEDELRGTVTSVDSATQFTLVVLDEIPDVAGVQVGNKITVTLAGGAQFSVNADSAGIPAGLNFGSAADLMVGQTLDIRPISGSSGTSIVTDRVRLESSQFTGVVLSISGSNFIVSTLPPLFTSAGIAQIQVTTSSQTEFDEVSGVGGLAVGNQVALRGLLFNALGMPTLVATKVRKL